MSGLGHAVHVSRDETQRGVDLYFDLMVRGEDFAVCYADDVTWLSVDSNRLVEKPQQVRNFITALHGQMVDAQTVRIVVGDGWAYLEGHCASDRSRSGARRRYCVAYDLAGEQIAAMRGYGPIGDLEP